MTGHLLVKCGSCGATNRVKSLYAGNVCVECKVPISKIEIPQVGVLLCDIDARFLGVSADDIRRDKGIDNLSKVLGRERVEVPK